LQRWRTINIPVMLPDRQTMPRGRPSPANRQFHGIVTHGAIKHPSREAARRGTMLTLQYCRDFCSGISLAA